jgi:hypothetical protein
MKMRTLAYVAMTVALAAASFGAGYWFRDLRGPTNADMEDVALSSILENIGYAAFIAKGDVPRVRDLIDVNLNNDIARLIRYQGPREDEQFEAAKIRTLNAAARLWDERPPFAAGAGAIADAIYAPWLPEWREITARNMKLLDWAKSQCANNPALRCATGPAGR